MVEEDPDRIVGARVVGHEGAELIHIFALAMKHGISATALHQMVDLLRRHQEHGWLIPA